MKQILHISEVSIALLIFLMALSPALAVFLVLSTMKNSVFRN